MRHLIILFFVSCVGAGSHAASIPAAAPAPLAPSTCDAQALNSVDYARSIDAVRRLPEVVAWSRSHPDPVAYGESMDRQVVLDGRCYWSVSVYANRRERLELWHVFYVEAKAKAKGQRLLVQDPDSGEAISLQTWRAIAEKS